jgi:hypothetical protein
MKNVPTPQTIHLSSGAHSEEKAIAPSSWKMRLEPVPSGFIAAIAESFPMKPLRSLTVSHLPSRKNEGKISEYTNSNSGSGLTSG